MAINASKSIKEVKQPLSRERIGTPARTAAIIRKYGLNLKKSLGQNFLTDGNVLQKIVAAAELDASKGALEIGPGIGALTEHLAEAAGRVAAVEIDQRLLPILADTLQDYENVKILGGDVLKLDLPAVIEPLFEGMAFSIVANLPYYVTTPIIMKCLESGLNFEYMVVMIQKEVAERMSASPGTKDYGSLSVAVQYYCETELAAVVPRRVFIPQPNVDSAVIKLKRREQPAVSVRDEDFFFQVVQACFAQRRKTLGNNLMSRFFQKEEKQQMLDLLENCGIDPVRRGETLSLQEFARLSDALHIDKRA